MIAAEMFLIGGVPFRARFRARFRTLWLGYVSLSAVAAIILMIRATVLAARDVVGRIHG